MIWTMLVVSFVLCVWSLWNILQMALKMWTIHISVVHNQGKGKLTVSEPKGILFAVLVNQLGFWGMLYSILKLTLQIL